jgi:alpha-mannosidase
MSEFSPHREWVLSDEEWCFQRINQWLKLLRANIYAEWLPLKVEFAPCADPLDLAGNLSANYRAISEGDRWGQAWDYGWFKFSAQVPAAWTGKQVDARINLNGEAGVLNTHGEIIKRLTAGSVFDVWYEVDDVALLASAKGGEAVQLQVQAWASKLDGISRPDDPQRDDADKNGRHDGLVRMARINVVRPEVKALFHDAEILAGVAQHSPSHTTRRARAVKALMDAIVAWQDNPARSAEARKLLAPELTKPATASALDMVATGHAHIDTGWLWRVRDSIGKCARTFAAQADLIEKYPGYIFGASSAQHYAFVKAHYPNLHQRIQKLVKADRWEIQGGMWVEPDTNLPSGESLIRQLLYGMKFIRQEFGVECPIAWLPDVFGLSAALPQILAGAGVRYLLTKKPHWSRFNAYPDTTFRWAGHDGSEVLVHVLPQVRDYNGQMRFEDVMLAEKGFAEKDRLDSFLYTFGVGDGGGGPSEPMLERALRMKSLEGAPRLRFGTAREVFEHFDQCRDLLKERRGDIYVEGHRGTYTTQGRLKAENRRMEILLGQIEHLYCHLPESDYPHEALETMWQTLLLHQFHDILPGSSIREVYEDVAQANAKVFSGIEKLREAFAATLPESPGRLTLFNGLGAEWRGCLPTAGGASALSQTEPDSRVVSLVTVPPLGFASLIQDAAAPAAIKIAEPVLENSLLRCRFDNNGKLISVFDKQLGREMLPEGGSGNRLSLYVDRPVDWDAWDVDHFYQQECVGVAVAAAPWRGWSGPARSVLEFSLGVGGSDITQRCILEADSRRIDFETVVNWRERHRFLRVGFDADVRDAVGRCEIQHGFYDRPAHQNTAYEKARFELPCHRYACLLDRDGGAAVLNDSKYGVRLQGTLIELALLRSTTFPDHAADEGEHRFTYSYLAFAGDFAQSGVPLEAARLNVRPVAFANRDASRLSQLFTLNGQGLAVEAVKRSESGSGIIVRLVENLGRSATAIVTPAETRATIAATDLLESPLAEAVLNPMPFRPFQLRTLRIGER